MPPLTSIHRNNCYHLPRQNVVLPTRHRWRWFFDTAWFSLVERGRFTEGETVLVLGASGGVGLAALQLVRGEMGGHALCGYC